MASPTNIEAEIADAQIVLMRRNVERIAGDLDDTENISDQDRLSIILLEADLLFFQMDEWKHVYKKLMNGKNQLYVSQLEQSERRLREALSYIGVL